MSLYLLTTFCVIPHLAPLFGREKIKENEFLEAHSFFYKLANRNYVRPQLNRTLQSIAKQFEKENTGIKLIYLDANFPFFNGFPLLPHLSHNDGKKVDVSLVYESSEGVITNKKPSVSGYGIYESPTKKEYNQTTICKENGNWQYDFPKYLSFGRINKEIEFSESGTRQLLQLMMNEDEIEKIFIEPHLKKRLDLHNAKIRFHGCRVVRHDDHIHFQIK